MNLLLLASVPCSGAIAYSFLVPLPSVVSSLGFTPLRMLQFLYPARISAVSLCCAWRLARLLT